MHSVKEILATIEAEIESIRQVQSYAVVARHDFIQRKLETLSTAYEELLPMLGPESTIEILSVAMDSMNAATQEVAL